MAHWRYGALGVALLGLAVGACSPLQALDTLVPETTYREVRNLTYGDGERQKLDLYLPLQRDNATPVVVFFYGGSWKSGERRNYRFVGEALASRGIVTVVPDYRLYPENRYPAFLQDSAAAVAWVKRQIAAYGGDPSRVFLAGHSAGAYNAAMLAVDPQYLNAAIGGSAGICGVISMAGPIGVNLQDYKSTRPIFSHAVDAESTRPVMHVKPGGPSFLLMHGQADSTVYPINTEMFEAALRQSGNTVEVEYIPGIGHYRIIAGLADPLENRVVPFPIADRIATFVRAQGHCPS